MISFAVTVKLICVFVFAYADCWFSHEAAHIYIYAHEKRDNKLFPNLMVTSYMYQDLYRSDVDDSWAICNYLYKMIAFIYIENSASSYLPLKTTAHLKMCSHPNTALLQADIW